MSPVYTTGPVQFGLAGKGVPKLAIDRPGQGYRLKFAYVALGVELFSAVTEPFDVSVGICAGLSVVAQPMGALLGVPFERAVMVEMQVCYEGFVFVYFVSVCVFVGMFRVMYVYVYTRCLCICRF